MKNIDRQTALIDTGAPAFGPRLVENIRQLIDPAKLDFVVFTHTDVDHAGGALHVMQVAPKARLVSPEGEAKALPLYGLNAPVQPMKDGETLSLGRRTLRFVATPFVETPGAMFIFEESERILFTGDAFASVTPEWQLFATGDLTETLKMVQKVKLDNSRRTIEAIRKAGELRPAIIAPGHGPALRDNLGKYIAELSSVEPY